MLLPKIKYGKIIKGAAALSLLCLSSLASAQSAQYYVSSTGSDDTGDGSLDNPWQSIQKAMFTVPFDVDAADINLRGGTYVLANGLFINELRGGSEKGTFRIKNYEKENAIVDGSNIGTFGAMFTIVDANYVTVEGLEITNLIGNKSGVHISGSSSNINILKNEIHGMHWTTDATAANSPNPSDNLNPVVVLGNSETPMTNISVMNNYIHDLTTGYSEAVKIVGNVDGFIVESNTIFDVSNICIVAAGNYTYTGVSDPDLNRARNGIIRYNETYRCVSPIAASAGIYADGAKDVFITDNYSHNNTVGFSIGSEQIGEGSGIILSRNDSSRNTQAGLVLGTNTSGATVSDIIITENEFYGNFTDAVSGGAPIIFSNAENVTISDNDISSISEFMITSNGLVTNLSINRNTYSSTAVEPSAAVFTWTGISGEAYFSFGSYKLATGQDNLSTFNAE